MSKNILKVGDIVSIPFVDGQTYKGEVLCINDQLLDPRMKYEIAFGEINIIMFYSESAIRNLLKLNN